MLWRPDCRQVKSQHAMDEKSRALRAQINRYLVEHVYPAEGELDAVSHEHRNTIMCRLMSEAKQHGLWTLGHPKELGGQGAPFMAYVELNEVIGRSFYAMQALGTLSLQDSLMLHRHAAPECRQKYLEPIVAEESVPSEPGRCDSAGARNDGCE